MLLKNIYQKVIDLVQNQKFSINFYVFSKNGKGLEYCAYFTQTYKPLLANMHVFDIHYDFENMEIIINLKGG